MRIKERIKSLPQWIQIVIVLSLAFIIVFGVQRIFVKLVFPPGDALRYWNLKWMRHPSAGIYKIDFFGHDFTDWIWIDTFIFFVSTFLSTAFASFIISLKIKKITTAFLISLGIGIAGIIPTILVFIRATVMPRHILIVFTVCKYELVEWTAVSAVAGVVFFFLINIIYINITKRIKNNENKKENER